MKIENSFTIDAPVDDAWQLLTDIPAIAPCLPGAKLTDETDGVYSGSVKVKVGPVTAEYKGTAQFVERDDDNHRAVIDGKGRDSRGAGNAQALITAEMRDVGGATQVDISTDLKITGKVAQFGRGVMQDVSEKLLGQFAECLATKLEGTSALEDIAAASASTDSTDATDSTDSSDAASGPSSSVEGAARDDVERPHGDGGVAETDRSVESSAAPTAAADDHDDDDALDLLDVAGGAVARRMLPIALLLVAVIVVLVLLLG